MLDLKNIQEKIATAIKNSGKTQTHIAKALNVTQSCIAHYIKGDIVPSLDTFAKLCVILDEDPKDLLCIDLITPQEKIDMILYMKAEDQKNQTKDTDNNVTTKNYTIGKITLNGNGNIEIK